MVRVTTRSSRRRLDEPAMNESWDYYEQALDACVSYEASTSEMVLLFFYGRFCIPFFFFRNPLVLFVPRSGHIGLLLSLSHM